MTIHDGQLLVELAGAIIVGGVLAMVLDVAVVKVMRVWAASGAGVNENQEYSQEKEWRGRLG